MIGRNVLGRDDWPECAGPASGYTQHMLRTRLSDPESPIRLSLGTPAKLSAPAAPM